MPRLAHRAATFGFWYGRIPLAVLAAAGEVAGEVLLKLLSLVSEEIAPVALSFLRSAQVSWPFLRRKVRQGFSLGFSRCRPLPLPLVSVPTALDRLARSRFAVSILAVFPDASPPILCPGSKPAVGAVPPWVSSAVLVLPAAVADGCEV